MVRMGLPSEKGIWSPSRRFRSGRDLKAGAVFLAEAEFSGAALSVMDQFRARGDNLR